MRARFTMRAPRPFDLALTARVLRRSTRNPIDRVDDDGRWSRVLALPGGPSRLVGEQRGDRLAFELSPPGDVEAARGIVRRLFGLDVDLAPFWERARREPRFAEVARRCAGLRPQRFPSLFEAAANAVCCQQVSLDAGLSVLGRLADRFGPRAPGDGQPGPPDPRAIAASPAPPLRAAGLSLRKAESLRALAAVDEREWRALERMPNEEARVHLNQWRGIGPWSADYVLLRGLGRLDVFPRGDVGAANALTRLLGEPIAPARAAEVVARFAPLQGMVYFCMRGIALASA